MYELIKAYRYFKFLRRTRKRKIYPNPTGEEYITRKEFDKIKSQLEAAPGYDGFGDDED